MLYSRSLLFICFIYSNMSVLISNFITLSVILTKNPYQELPGRQLLALVSVSSLLVHLPNPLLLLVFLPCYPLFGDKDFAEKAMATHSSTLAWKIPWMEEPGRLQSMGSLGVGHDWATSLSLFTFMRWRRKWQPTPVFLSGESQGWGSLMGCHLWGRAELDMTEVT